MTMRLLKLPADLIPLAEMTGETWQYPENEEWSVRPEETAAAIDSVRNLSRIWALVRLVQLFSPGLRDLLHGFVWEEDGQIAGFTNVSRRGTTDTWYASAIGVLPAYRRQGIARKLAEATIDFVLQRGGKRLLGDVIDGNLPVRRLCDEMGFEHYSSIIEFIATPEEAPPVPQLPEGYAPGPLGFFDWESRYELEKRITPERVLRYEPVEEGQFQRPALTRFLFPLFALASGTRGVDFVVRTVAGGQVVARGRYDIHAHSNGRSSIAIRLDPAHSELASYLVGYMLHQVAMLSPGHQVHFSVPQWMEALVVAAEQAGFVRRMELLRIGLEL